MDNSVSVHYKNLEFLATAMYKVFNGILPDAMKDVFPLNTSSNYIIRKKSTFYSKSVNSVLQWV